MNNYRNPLLAGCALMALLSAPVAALAQDDAKKPAQDETLITELTVTAERRSESIQDVPIAITGFDDKTRERLGIATVQDLAQFTPGLSYNTTTDRPQIRGIGRQSNTFSLDSPVASYVDGVYTSSVQDANRRPMFIERTEILRGPQGALSGRGSIAGAINTISKQPSKTFGGAWGLIAGNYGRYGAEGTVTGPLNSWLQGRANIGVYRQRDGFFTNLANGTTEGNQPNNRTIYDFMLKGQPTEHFEFFTKLAFSDYSETRHTVGSLAPFIAGSDPCVPGLGTGTAPSAYYGLFPAGTACGQVRLTVSGIPTGNPLGSPTSVAFNNQPVQLGTIRSNPATPGNLRVFSNDFTATQGLDDHHNFTFDATWHTPFADVRYVGGHQNYLYTQLTDADGTDVLSYLVGAAAYNAADPANPTITTRRIFPSAVNLYQEERKWYSHELNVTSTTESPFQWIFGLYQSDEKYEQTPQAVFYKGFTNALAQPTLSSAGTPTAGALPANVSPGRATYGHLIGKTVSTAAFGQADYELSKQFKITAGLRYNKDEKDVVEDARYLSIASTAAGDVVTDNTFGFFRGYGVVNPATAVVPPGYRLVDVSGYPISPTDATKRILPDGSTVNATGQALLFAPGVVDFPTTNAQGARVRHLNNSWSAVTGSLGINWTPNEDTLVYLRAARGYRPGGFNAGFINAVPETESEFVNSYEAGSKMTVNSHLLINTAAFYYDYTDIQLPLPIFDRCTTPGDFATCSSVNSFINLPSATSKGLEVELQWYPTDNLGFFVSYGYLDAKIKDGTTLNGFENGSDPAAILPGAQRFLPINCNLTPPVVVPPAVSPGATSTAACRANAPGSLTNFTGLALDSITALPRYTQTLSGNPIPNSPKNKIAVNGSYTFRKVMDKGDVQLSLTYIWRDKAIGNLFNNATDITPAYSQINTRATFNSKDDKYQVIFYVQNLLDEDVAENASVVRRSVSGAGSGQVFYRSYDLAPPRTFGVEIQHRF